MSKFSQKVIFIVRSIPLGKVMSYGQVALYTGLPRAARQVGWTLNRLEDTEDVPWWRVVNNTGRISIKGSVYTPCEQRELLIKENIKISKDFTFDIKAYRYIPDIKTLKSFQLDPLYLQMISAKVPYQKYFRND